MSPPALLDDRYVLTERLATNRSCSAYRARDSRLRRDVTVALLERPDDDAGRAFQHGARRLAQATDPDAVRVYDGAGTYLVTEAVAEEELRPLLDAVTAREPGVAADLADGGRPAGPLAVEAGERRPRLLALTSGLVVAVLAGGLAALPARDMPTVEGVPAPAAPEQPTTDPSAVDRGRAVAAEDPGTWAAEPSESRVEAQAVVSDPAAAAPASRAADDAAAAETAPDRQPVPEAPGGRSADPEAAPEPEGEAPTASSDEAVTTAGADAGPPAHANAAGDGRGHASGRDGGGDRPGHDGRGEGSGDEDDNGKGGGGKGGGKGNTGKGSGGKG